MRIPTLALAFARITVGISAVLWSSVAIASAAPPKCGDLSGVIDGAQTCQIQATDPAYALSINYPVNYPDAQAVFDYVKQTRDGFLNVAKMPGPHDMPYELETTATEYSSAVPPRGTQSLVFKTFQDVGGAHPQTFFQTFNWDQTLRKPIQIDTGGSDKIQPLFQAGANPWPVIFPIVQSELDKQSGQPVAISPAVGLDPTKYENFAITNDAIIFFFSQGELLPEAAGALQVSVPRGPIDAMIA
ncbi:DUF3298 domain-containing protein [Mycolicibacterium sp. P9-64]|uniref:esterase n=1 Tax=Mycolicibacterium sp. P9-64 TaxID=2024612 RepID=UPI0011EDC6F9|nr:esterase [Mycolicibacterium sp. P9-64]KAA0081100.1 DUF3298 domain-containing protein [Mycolicibacterium sp. P9-64]